MENIEVNKEFKQKLSDYVQDYLNKNRITQAGYAAKIDVNQGYISRILNSYYWEHMSTDMWIEIAEKSGFFITESLELKIRLKGEAVTRDLVAIKKYLDIIPQIRGIKTEDLRQAAYKGQLNTLIQNLKEVEKNL